MPLSFWLYHYLDSRTEILPWLFGKLKTPKSHSEINWPLVFDEKCVILGKKVLLPSGPKIFPPALNASLRLSDRNTYIHLHWCKSIDICNSIITLTTLVKVDWSQKVFHFHSNLQKWVPNHSLEQYPPIKIRCSVCDLAPIFGDLSYGGVHKLRWQEEVGR